MVSASRATLVAALLALAGAASFDGAACAHTRALLRAGASSDTESSGIVEALGGTSVAIESAFGSGVADSPDNEEAVAFAAAESDVELDAPNRAEADFATASTSGAYAEQQSDPIRRSKSKVESGAGTMGNGRFSGTRAGADVAVASSPASPLGPPPTLGAAFAQGIAEAVSDGDSTSGTLISGMATTETMAISENALNDANSMNAVAQGAAQGTGMTGAYAASEDVGSAATSSFMSEVAAASVAAEGVAANEQGAALGRMATGVAEVAVEGGSTGFGNVEAIGMSNFMANVETGAVGFGSVGFDNGILRADGLSWSSGTSGLSNYALDVMGYSATSGGAIGIGSGASIETADALFLDGNGHLVGGVSGSEAGAFTEGQLVSAAAGNFDSSTVSDLQVETQTNSDATAERGLDLADASGKSAAFALGLGDVQKVDPSIASGPILSQSVIHNSAASESVQAAGFDATTGITFAEGAVGGANDAMITTLGEDTMRAVSLLQADGEAKSGTVTADNRGGAGGLAFANGNSKNLNLFAGGDGPAMVAGESSFAAATETESDTTTAIGGAESTGSANSLARGQNTDTEEVVEANAGTTATATDLAGSPTFGTLSGTNTEGGIGSLGIARANGEYISGGQVAGGVNSGSVATAESDTNPFSASSETATGGGLEGRAIGEFSSAELDLGAMTMSDSISGSVVAVDLDPATAAGLGFTGSSGMGVTMVSGDADEMFGEAAATLSGGANADSAAMTLVLSGLNEFDMVVGVGGAVSQGAGNGGGAVATLGSDTETELTVGGSGDASSTSGALSVNESPFGAGVLVGAGDAMASAGSGGSATTEGEDTAAQGAAGGMAQAGQESSALPGSGILDSASASEGSGMAQGAVELLTDGEDTSVQTESITGAATVGGADWGDEGAFPFNTAWVYESEADTTAGTQSGGDSATGGAATVAFAEGAAPETGGPSADGLSNGAVFATGNYVGGGVNTNTDSTVDVLVPGEGSEFIRITPGGDLKAGVSAAEGLGFSFDFLQNRAGGGGSLQKFVWTEADDVAIGLGAGVAGAFSLDGPDAAVGFGSGIGSSVGLADGDIVEVDSGVKSVTYSDTKNAGLSASFTVGDADAEGMGVGDSMALATTTYDPSGFPDATANAQALGVGSAQADAGNGFKAMVLANGIATDQGTTSMTTAREYRFGIPSGP